MRWALNQEPPITQREGKGIKGDPFKYFLPPLPPAYTREGEKEKHENDVTLDNHLPYSNYEDLSQKRLWEREPGWRNDRRRGLL